MLIPSMALLLSLSGVRSTNLVNPFKSYLVRGSYIFFLHIFQAQILFESFGLDFNLAYLAYYVQLR